MDSKGLPQLQHRCGTCDEIFQSIEELCEHTNVHVRLAEERSAPPSADRNDIYQAPLDAGAGHSQRPNRGLPER